MARQFWRQYFFLHDKRNSCSVLISYIVTHSFVVNNQKTDNDVPVLILDVTINGVNFVLINLYNTNTETEQVSVLNNLTFKKVWRKFRDKVHFSMVF